MVQSLPSPPTPPFGDVLPATAQGWCAAPFIVQHLYLYQQHAQHRGRHGL